jgi:hypothetical protein
MSPFSSAPPTIRTPLVELEAQRVIQDAGLGWPAAFATATSAFTAQRLSTSASATAEGGKS